MSIYQNWKNCDIVSWSATNLFASIFIYVEIYIVVVCIYPCCVWVSHQCVITYLLVVKEESVLLNNTGNYLSRGRTYPLLNNVPTVLIPMLKFCNFGQIPATLWHYFINQLKWWLIQYYITFASDISLLPV